MFYRYGSHDVRTNPQRQNVFQMPKLLFRSAGVGFWQPLFRSTVLGLFKTTFPFCRDGFRCFVSTWWVFAEKTGGIKTFYRHGLFYRHGYVPKPMTVEHFTKPTTAERFKKPMTVQRSGSFVGLNISRFSERHESPRR